MNGRMKRFPEHAMNSSSFQQIRYSPVSRPEGVYLQRHNVEFGEQQNSIHKTHCFPRETISTHSFTVYSLFIHFILSLFASSSPGGFSAERELQSLFGVTAGEGWWHRVGRSRGRY